MNAPRAKRASCGRVTFGLGVLACASLSGGLASANVEPEDAAKVANEVDEDIAVMQVNLQEIKTGYAVTTSAEVGKVERRLREGEIHFLLKDYLRSAIVLLDVVEDPQYANHAKMDECRFLLAEALRSSRNFSGAEQYYEAILPRVSGERLKDVVLGLLQIAGATNRYDDVDRHVARLRETGTLSRPDVDYIYGKMLFKGGIDQPEKMNRAYDVFSKIPEGNSASARAGYYAGVALVQLGRYEQAVTQFTQTLGRLGKRADDQSLRELIYLSLGRLQQELGDVAKSADAYQEIAQNSPYFSDMLFEVAWAHVTDARLAKEPEPRKAAFVRALRALELLMATAPDSRLYPQARILQGNLQIRLGAPETAYDTFQTIVDEYGGARDKIQRMIATQTDTKQFFRNLLEADLDELHVQNVLPPLAVTWALEEDDMERAVTMERDLTESDKFLLECRELVDTLETALAGEQRFNMFPGLKDARSKAIAVENRVLDGRRRLLALERAIVANYISPAQQSEIDEAHVMGRNLEREISNLPQDDVQVDRGRDEIRQAYLSAGRQAHRLRPRVSGMRAQLVAVEMWMRDNRDTLSQEEQTLMDNRLMETRRETEALERDLAVLERDIEQAAQVVEGDGGRGHVRELAAQYDAVQAKEIALLRTGRASVPGDMQGALQRIDQQRVALDGVDSQLEAMQSALDAKIRKEVDEIRYSIAQEVGRLDKYEQEQATLAAQTQGLLGPVADRTLAAVGKQFRDLVLKADVGIIDVAWARKQGETDKVNDLIREQQRRNQELEAEFVDFLKE